MNIDQLRYRGRPIFWRYGYLFADGLGDPGQHLAWEGNGRWRAFRAHDEGAEVGRDAEDAEPADTSEFARRAAVLQCLVDVGVLTVEPTAAVMSTVTAPASAKFIRLAAPLQPTEYDILRAAGVDVVYGAESTFTADIPAAKADAIVALLSALNIHAKSYEV